MLSTSVSGMGHGIQPIYRTLVAIEKFRSVKSEWAAAV